MDKPIQEIAQELLKDALKEMDAGAEAQIKREKLTKENLKRLIFVSNTVLTVMSELPNVDSDISRERAEGFREGINSVLGLLQAKFDLD